MTVTDCFVISTYVYLGNDKNIYLLFKLMVPTYSLSLQLLVPA